MPLALTRNLGETVVLHTGAGERVVIEFAEQFRARSIKLAITAPMSVKVYRGEVEHKPVGGGSTSVYAHGIRR